MPFTQIENAIAAIGRGELVVVVDDADRENEGDLIMAAEKITPETMAFMIRHTSGVICMPIEGERLDELQLPLMVAHNTESQRTAFTVSVDAVQRHHDRHLRGRPRHDGPHAHRPGDAPRRPRPARATSSRCATARAACSSGPATPRPRSTSPGSPGCVPAGVLAEVVNDDGTMARLPQLERSPRSTACSSSPSRT